MKLKLPFTLLTLFLLSSTIGFKSNLLNATNCVDNLPLNTRNSMFAAPVVGNSVVENITATTARWTGVINSDGGSTITERGFIYSITSVDPTPTLAEVGGGNVTKIIFSGTNNIFQIDVTGLTPSTGYTIKPYAINADGSGEGNISTFTTDAAAALPTVTTGGISIVTQDAAIPDINISSDGGGAISEAGVVVSLTSVNSNPTIGGTGVSKTAFDYTGSIGYYDEAISGLEGNSNYTYRAFATNETGTSYGTAQTFTTIPNPGLSESRYIVNSLGNSDRSNQGTITSSSTWVQQFIVGDNDVTLTAITIEAFGTGTVSISIRDASGNGAGNLIETLGNVSSSSSTSSYQRVLSSTNPTLSANTSYYVHATHVSGSLSWDFATDNGNTGTGGTIPTTGVFNNGTNLPGPMLDLAVEGIVNCSAPINQATSPVFGSKTSSSLTLLSFTAPIDGASGYVVYINDTDSFSPPTEGSEPLVDTSWNNSGQQAIYFGLSESPSVSVTGLDPASTYFFRIYAYNDCVGIEAYETTGLGASDTTSNLAGFTVVESLGNTETSEAGTTDTFTVVLDAEPSSDVVIDAVSGDTGEGTVDVSSLTFTTANWDTPQAVTVTGVDDVIVDGTQTFDITLSVDAALSDDAFDGLAAQAVSVDNTDDDVVGFTVVESSGNTETSEAGTTDTFTVVLDAEPSSDVVIDVVSGDTGEGTVDVSSLTFTTANWDTPQAVTVTGVDDDLVDGTQTFNVTLSVDAALSDDAFDGLAAQAVSVDNTDDDVAGFTVVESLGNTETSEAGTTDTFTVVLDAEPSSDVVIDVMSGDTGEGMVDVSSLTFTTANWNTPQTVTVTGVDDVIVDGTQTFNVTLSVDAALSDDAFDGLAAQAVSVDNTDDDGALSTSSIVDEVRFSIFPNPAKTEIKIKSDYSGDFIIINQLGQIVKRFNLNFNEEIIYIGDLNEGLYFVKAIASFNTSSQKLIITK